MTWMGAKADIAAITALDTTGLQDNIVFAAASELKFLLLQKTSTATVDGVSVWAAVPSGRWHLTGGSGGGGSIEVVADLAALQLLTSASQDKIYALNTTPPQTFIWDAESTAAVSADIVKLTALTNGRMYKIYPVASGGSSNLMIAANIATITALNTTSLPDGIHYYAIAEKLTLVLDKSGLFTTNTITCWAATGGGAWIVHPNSIIVSPDPPDPSNSALIGTTWIWAETAYETDLKRSVITYIWALDPNGSDPAWHEVSSRIRYGPGTPTALGIPINGFRGFYVDLLTNFLYYPKDTVGWQKVLV